MTNAHARVKHRKVIKARKPSITLQYIDNNDTEKKTQKVFYNRYGVAFNTRKERDLSNENSLIQLEPNTEEYKRRKELLSSRKTLTKAQALCLEHMNQNKPILVFKEAP